MYVNLVHGAKRERENPHASERLPERGWREVEAKNQQVFTPYREEICWVFERLLGVLHCAHLPNHHYFNFTRVAQFRFYFIGDIPRHLQ